jgi:hypothetical protein
MGSIGFVIIVPLVFESRDDLSAVLRLVDGMYTVCASIVACKEREVLPGRSGYMGHHHPAFLDCLRRLGEVIECSWDMMHDGLFISATAFLRSFAALH